MNNLIGQINGVFTISVDGKEHPNLVVNSGLANIFQQSTIASLCHTLKVFDDETEVLPADTDFTVPLASSTNITNTVYGVSGTGVGDYFYMKRTWTFARGQIEGVLSKLAVYSDDGSLYAAALLKDENGDLDPVRPLFAPKVEVTYESRWHFKQDESYTIGTPVFFSDSGLVMVKSNRAAKNDSATYNMLDEPFKVLSVELFSDTITSDDSEPLLSLGAVDSVDYDVTYLDSFGVYGQTLNLTLPKSKYINDLPIATIVILTTRGKWQFGFDAPIAKPTLSKREIRISLPFLHGTVDASGIVTPTGNPEAIGSIYSELKNSTYNVSTRVLTYDGTGTIAPDLAGYSGKLLSTVNEFNFIVPDSGTVVLAFGQSALLNDYLGTGVTGIVLKCVVGATVTGYVESEVINDATLTMSPNDSIQVTIHNGLVSIENITQMTAYTTSAASSFITKPASALIGMIDVAPTSSVIVY